MGLLKNIQWTDNTKDTIVYKVDMKNDYISKGSALTVRESQAAVFCDKGKMGDVFLPGFYKLDTDSLPIITKLMSWKYGFENPFRSDVYFVNTKQFAGEKWGTTNPIIIRDRDYGAVRVRGYGTYSFRVVAPYIFMTELSGTNSSYKTKDITDYLRSMVVMGISDAIGESKIPVLDMAANLIEVGQMVQKSLDASFKKMGIAITQFNFENFSMPEELEKALDKNASLGMMRGNMDTYMAMAQADALKDAAKNPGVAGDMMGAGLGFGMGTMFSNMYGPGMAKPAAGGHTTKCAKCGTEMSSSAKFCPTCGQPAGLSCPKCKAVVKAGAKFCPECGAALKSSCPKCGAAVPPGVKFCPECGEKMK